MKSFTKFCLILAGVFVVLGIVGVTAGMAMGAQPKQFLNLVHYKNSVLPWGSTAEKLEDNIEDYLEDNIENEWLDDWDEEPDYLNEDWEDYHLPEVKMKEKTTDWEADTFEGAYGNAETQKLELDLNKSVVEIYTHEGEDILINGSNAKGYFETKLDGDTLILQDHRGSSRKALHLEIYLPKRMFKAIEIDLGASKFYAEELNAEKLEFELGAGEVHIGSIDGQKVSLETGSGSCVVDTAAARTKAELGVGAGEFVVNSYEGGNLDLECGIGSLSVSAKGKEKDYNYEISCGIGSVLVGDSSYTGLGHEKTLNNGADKKISVECGIGEVVLEFEN